MAAALRGPAHRTETSKLSKDPLFVQKVWDIVGLYLDPPERALVLSLDARRPPDCSFAVYRRAFSVVTGPRASTAKVAEAGSLKCGV